MSSGFHILMPYHIAYAPGAFPILSVGVFSMVLWVGIINEDIVKEDQDEFVQVLTKKSVHHIHELGKAVGDAKRHNQKFIKPPPCLKCCFVKVFWLYWHLPIP